MRMSANSPVAVRGPGVRRRYTSPPAFSLDDIKAGSSVRAAFLAPAAASLSRDGEEVTDDDAGGVKCIM